MFAQGTTWYAFHSSYNQSNEGGELKCGEVMLSLLRS